MNLKEYYKDNNINIVEGYSQEVEREIEILKEQSSKENIKNILEIGFNAGHSAELFLQNSKANIISFDIGIHHYVDIGYKYLKSIYDKRLELVLGDSNVTVPQLETEIKYDLIFIDGAHTTPIAYNDIKNCKRLSHKDTILIIDDTIKDEKLMHSFNKEVNDAWNKCIEEGIVEEVYTEDFSSGRGISIGRYL
jgi:predicted O-methyltransferase YrrM